MILRIIDKETQLFLRDDFTFDEKTEIGLDVAPAQGLYKPKWSFDTEEWIEGATGEEIEEIKTNAIVEPTLEERIQELELMMINEKGMKE